MCCGWVTLWWLRHTSGVGAAQVGVTDERRATAQALKPRPAEARRSEHPLSGYERHSPLPASLWMYPRVSLRLPPDEWHHVVHRIGNP